MNNHLRNRLKFLQHMADIGIVPGEMDTFERTILSGRILELKNVLDTIEMLDKMDEIKDEWIRRQKNDN